MDDKQTKHLGPSLPYPFMESNNCNNPTTKFVNISYKKVYLTSLNDKIWFNFFPFLKEKRKKERYIYIVRWG